MTARVAPLEAESEVLWQNETRLVGRVAAPPEPKELPSGDRIVTFRLIVPRVPEPETGPRVDTLDCVARTGRLRQRCASLPADAVVEVGGAIRRRFWRGPVGPESRWEIEISSLSKLAVVAPVTRRRGRN
jgi:single-strand DNA-binding protein